MKFAASILFFVLALSPQSAAAQDTRALQLRINADNINQTLASTILWSAQRTLSGGKFYFDPDASGASRTMTIVKVPGRYTFENIGTRIHPTIEGLASTVTLEDEILLDGKKADSDYLIEGYSLGAGAGVRIDVEEQFYFYLGARFVYTHLSNTLNVPALSQAAPIEVPPDIFDWEMNALSILPKIDFEWQGDYDWGLLQLAGDFVYLRSETVHSVNPLIDVSSESYLSKYRVEAGRDLGLDLFDYPLSTRAFYEFALLMGDIRDAINDDFTHTTGLRFVVDTRKFWDGLFDNTALSVSYTWGDSFYGWLAGFGINY
ncbi:MAG: hypothetical protein KDD66_07095 [Bdellovibrionales bacterium]|nr:hypothetical protein [Bdellovibrionales bacterium]